MRKISEVIDKLADTNPTGELEGKFISGDVYEFNRLLKNLVIDNIKELKKELKNTDISKKCPCCGIVRFPSGEAFIALDEITNRHAQIKILKEIFEISEEELK